MASHLSRPVPEDRDVPEVAGAPARGIPALAQDGGPLAARLVPGGPRCQPGLLSTALPRSSAISRDQAALHIRELLAGREQSKIEVAENVLYVKRRTRDQTTSRRMAAEPHVNLAGSGHDVCNWEHEKS